MTQPQLVATAWTSAGFAALRDVVADHGLTLSSSFRKLPVAEAVKPAAESAHRVL